MLDSGLHPGDTLITTKRFIESAMVLANHTDRSTLIAAMSKQPSLRLSIAYLIESIVLHEQLYCTFSNSILESITAQSRLSGIAKLFRPIPLDTLTLEMKTHGYGADVLQWESIYARLNMRPNIVVDLADLSLFNQAFPDLNKPENDMRSVPNKLRSAEGRLFLHYENTVSLAIGIAYALTGQEDSTIQKGLQQDNLNQTGYKIYGERTLEYVHKISQQRAEKLNDWLKKSRFSVEAPLVFNYVVEKAGTTNDILNVAMEVRHSKEAIAFRRHCAMFDEALQVGDDKIIKEMITEIEDKILQLSKHIGVAKFNIDISFPPSITISASQIVEYLQIRRKHHLNFISQLYEAALQSRSVYDRFYRLL